MFRFTIRELALVTLVVAMGVAWWIDRSALAWRYDKSAAAAAQLRKRLDAAEPGWPARGEAIRMPNDLDGAKDRARGGFATGVALFAGAGLLIFLVWQGNLHWSLLKERRRY